MCRLPIGMRLGGWRDLWFKMVSKWAFGAALPGQSEDVAILEQPGPKTMALEPKHTWWGIVPPSCPYREGDTGVPVSSLVGRRRYRVVWDAEHLWKQPCVH